MPNKRQKGLKLIAVWVDEESARALKKLAREHGTDMSDLLRRNIAKALGEDPTVYDKYTQKKKDRQR